jgi:hypothetical protein
MYLPNTIQTSWFTDGTEVPNKGQVDHYTYMGTCSIEYCGIRINKIATLDKEKLSARALAVFPKRRPSTTTVGCRYTVP